jgi:DNA-binding MarR family transcriptional regulator
MNNCNVKAFMDTCKRLTNKIGELEKHASEMTAAGRLSFSELSLISLIGEFENIKVTELSLKYGATKGAISKMVKKLAAKNLVQKHRTPENEKEVLLSLTALGKEIFQEKEAHLINLSQDIAKYLQDLSQEQVNVLFRVLQKVEEHIDEHLQPLDKQQQ